MATARVAPLGPKESVRGQAGIIPISRGFPALDGLRGVAAILVVAFHIRSYALGYEHFPAGDGYLAVDLFFFLSGVVLACAYLDRLQASISAKRFMVMRLVRLYPLYSLGLVIGSLSALWLGTSLSIVARADATEIFFLPSTFHNQLFMINNVSWSLFFEVLVNGAFALLAKRLNIRLSVVISLISWGFVVFITLSYGNLSYGNTWHTLFYAVPRTSFPFFSGVLVYQMFYCGRLRFNAPSWAFIPVTLLLICFLVIPVSDNLRPLFDLTFVTLVIPAIVLISMNVKFCSSWSRICTFLGFTSFAVYAIHYTIIEPVFLALANHTFICRGVGLFGLTVCFVVLLLLISYCLDRWFDEPVRRRLGAALNIHSRPMPRHSDQGTSRLSSDPL
jgi:peptidoglycan/LPS O-acetylase OafA/YrhL